jgi:hypothetical protein
VNLYLKNKPSKGRVKINPKNIMNGQQVLQSDVGGDGGDQYLFDKEELQKVLKEATGSVDNQKNLDQYFEQLKMN